MEQLNPDLDAKRDCEYIQASRLRVLSLWLGTLGVVLVIVSLVKLMGW